ncbi:hypothetical protein Pcinc_037156 [Petrolisthes cinctipes]|uniref:Uncharacterized protein n=1 Tax=Petrolisthes cinctipes TaxID=88211 RepID=A0AAE1ELN3_PETCI|nr:hypothetical protein Pcinc_037156 [Petrolisthes cinctipes]
MTARPRTAEGEFRVSSPSEEFLLGLISFHLLAFLSPFNRRSPHRPLLPAVDGEGGEVASRGAVSGNGTAPPSLVTLVNVIAHL